MFPISPDARNCLTGELRLLLLAGANLRRLAVLPAEKDRQASNQSPPCDEPQNSYRWGGPCYYIVTIGHYGFEWFSKFVVLDEQAALDRAATWSNG